jgi:hypothetical protein
MGCYSVRVEDLHPTKWKAFERRMSGVAYGSYAGFFAANRDVLGFDAVAEPGVPITPDAPKAEHVHFQAAYLFGSGVRGWTPDWACSIDSAIPAERHSLECEP